MQYTLKPHQIIGRDTLVRRAQWIGTDRYPHFILADEQRVGKCAQGLTAAATLGARRVAVLCKAIGRENWLEQRDIWTPDRPFKLWCESYDRYTVNSDVQASLKKFDPDILILDEAQFLRNRNAKRTMLAYGEDCEGDGFVQQAYVTWLMSGTLSANNAGELWTHLRALWDWPYDYFSHINRFCNWEMTKYGPRFYSLKAEALPELRRYLKKISLRRLFADVNPQAGAPVWTPVTLTAKASLAEINRLERDPGVRKTLERIIATEEFPDSAAGEQASEQLARVPLSKLRRLIGLAKVPLTVEYVRESLFEEAQVNHVMIGAWHLDVLDGLQRGFKGRRILRIDGRTTDAERKRIRKAWMRGEADIFLGQIGACGTSIDLSRADAAVLAESSWAPDDNWQFVFRALNIAKTRPLPVDVLSLANSTDVGVQRVNTRKGEQSSQVWGEAA